MSSENNGHHRSKLQCFNPRFVAVVLASGAKRRPEIPCGECIPCEDAYKTSIRARIAQGVDARPGVSWQFATFTFPRGTGVLQANRALRALTHSRWFRPRNGCKPVYFWVLEKTKAGTPHYHFVITGLDLPLIKPKHKQSLREYFASASPIAHELIAWLTQHGFGAITQIENVINPYAISRYISKYLGKKAERFPYLNVVQDCYDDTREEIRVRHARRYGSSRQWLPNEHAPLAVVRQCATQLSNGPGDGAGPLRPVSPIGIARNEPKVWKVARRDRCLLGDRRHRLLELLEHRRRCSDTDHQYDDDATGTRVLRRRRPAWRNSSAEREWFRLLDESGLPTDLSARWMKERVLCL